MADDMLALHNVVKRQGARTIISDITLSRAII